jgi:pyridoxine/pyridoxamine 5'-phosphate oxidase
MEPRATHARKEYEQGALDEATVARDPVRQFAAWYDAAVAAGVPEPEAMTLSTATPDGRPSARDRVHSRFSCWYHLACVSASSIQIRAGS